MKTNFIHQTAIIGENVTLGHSNYIGPYCVITGNTTIGNNNRFEAFCSIGTPPEYKGHFDDFAQGVVIGNRNVIREFVTINAGLDESTVITNDCILMKGVHIGHDSHIESHVTISCDSMIGGHSYIYEGANLGLGTILHQRSVIGAYSILGMGTIVTKKTMIEPGQKYVGTPAKSIGKNEIALIRNSVTDEDLSRLYLKWINHEQKNNY